MEKKVKDLIEEFINSQVDYGEITDIGANSIEIYNSIKDYILKNDSPLYVLKCQNRIFLSKNKPEFDHLYEVVKKFGTLLIEKGILEIWDDNRNKLLNVVFPSIKRHFLVKYSNERNKALKINAIINENP